MLTRADNRHAREMERKFSVDAEEEEEEEEAAAEEEEEEEEEPEEGVEDGGAEEKMASFQISRCNSTGSRENR